MGVDMVLVGVGGSICAFGHKMGVQCVGDLCDSLT